MHEECGSIPGGLHLEMTGDNVTECIGGGSGVTGGPHPRHSRLVQLMACSFGLFWGCGIACSKVCMRYGGRLQYF